MSNPLARTVSRKTVAVLWAVFVVLLVASCIVLSLPADADGNHWGALVVWLGLLIYVPVFIAATVMTVLSLTSKGDARELRWASVGFQTLASLPLIGALIMGIMAFNG